MRYSLLCCTHKVSLTFKSVYKTRVNVCAIQMKKEQPFHVELFLMSVDETLPWVHSELIQSLL